MTSSDINKIAGSILDEKQVSIGTLVKENIPIETRLILADHEHRNKQDALDRQHKRAEEVEQSKYKRRVEGGINVFVGLFVAVIGAFCVGIILNPKAPGELSKWACGLLGTFAGAGAGLIRRP